MMAAMGVLADPAAEEDVEEVEGLDVFERAVETIEAVESIAVESIAVCELVKARQDVDAEWQRRLNNHEPCQTQDGADGVEMEQARQAVKVECRIRALVLLDAKKSTHTHTRIGGAKDAY